jgi:hypothetical protein
VRPSCEGKVTREGVTKAEPSKREEEGDGVSSVPRDPAGAPVGSKRSTVEFDHVVSTKMSPAST